MLVIFKWFGYICLLTLAWFNIYCFVYTDGCVLNDRAIIESHSISQDNVIVCNGK